MSHAEPVSLPEPPGLGGPDDDLAVIVRSVFETMMELEVTPSDAPWQPAADRLTAMVQMEGPWNGAVLVEFDRRLCCLLAGRFLAMEPPAEVDDMVRDVIGELANMIGGNFKATLMDGIVLATPAVVDGSSASLRLVGAELSRRAAFACCGSVFWVTVLAVGGPPRPAA